MSRRDAWKEQASCREVPELPWLNDRDQVRASQTLAMKSVCASCAVFYECKDFVDCEGIIGGYWAGDHREPRNESVGGAA